MCIYIYIYKYICVYVISFLSNETTVGRFIVKSPDEVSFATSLPRLRRDSTLASGTWLWITCRACEYTVLCDHTW